MSGIEKVILDVTQHQPEGHNDDPHLPIIHAAIQLALQNAGGIQCETSIGVAQKAWDSAISVGKTPKEIAESTFSQAALHLFQQVLDGKRFSHNEGTTESEEHGTISVLQLQTVVFSPEQFGAFMVDIERNFLASIDAIVDAERQKWIDSQEVTHGDHSA